MGGSLTDSEISNIIAWCEPFIDTSRISTFIETGTYRGDTTMVAARRFSRVHSIEIKDDLYRNSVSRFREEGLNNIMSHHGDSVEVLPGIVASIEEPCMFFLDGHQSGTDTSNNGKQNVPLLNEIRCIFNNFHAGAILIIDDVRLFSRYWDWADISCLTIDKLLTEELGVTIAKKFIASDRYVVVVNSAIPNRE